MLALHVPPCLVYVPFGLAFDLVNACVYRPHRCEVTCPLGVGGSEGDYRRDRKDARDRHGRAAGQSPDASAVLIDAPPVTVPCLSRPGNLPTDPDLP